MRSSHTVDALGSYDDRYPIAEALRRRACQARHCNRPHTTNAAGHPNDTGRASVVFSPRELRDSAGSTGLIRGASLSHASR